MFHGETKPIESLPTPSWMANATPEASLPETSQAASPSLSAEASPQDTSTAAIDPSDWRAKFAGQFTDGAIEKTDTSYKSPNISVTITKVQNDTLTYFVADIYIAELKYFRTAFAQEADTMGHTELTTTVAQENNAIIAINGDFCLNNWSTGVVLRNGQPYKKNKPSADQFVLYYDGTMESIPPGEFNYDTVVAKGVYQIWSWGPMLLDNGQVMADFNMPDTFGAPNPRTAIGYYEPGHYCFVVVEGRQTYTDGIKLPELSQLFYDLGCTEAYNLDGGRTSKWLTSGNSSTSPLRTAEERAATLSISGNKGALC